MKKILTFITLALLLACGGSNDTPSKKSNEVKSKFDKAKIAGEIKAEFIHAWQAYKKYAWGHDALKPLSKGYLDWYDDSFLTTPIDAFDTMLLMGMKEEADSAKTLILSELNFEKDYFVQSFEINIRILGGLISAYQLDGDPRFLELATDLANRMLPIFNSATGMPYTQINLKTRATRGTISNPAEIGTYLLEFGMMSKLTGNPVYYRKAKKAAITLFNARSKIGLVGTIIDVETKEWQNTDSHISGMIDSYYEYLLKSYLLFGDKECRFMWGKSLEAVNKYLADSVKSGFWYGHADMNTGKRTKSYYGALDAFFPSLLVLEGDVRSAKNLQESNFKMWRLTGIEAEVLDYKIMRVRNTVYRLRPENIEAAYYLYHFTKDDRYLEMGYNYFRSIKRHCRNDAGYAALVNVVTKEKGDEMETFFLAETLKYLYLMFATDVPINPENVVFNTEGHPFPVIE